MAEDRAVTQQDTFMARSPVAQIGSSIASKISPNLLQCTLDGKEEMICQIGQKQELIVTCWRTVSKTKTLASIIGCIIENISIPKAVITLKQNAGSSWMS